jgi:hypothetical protein
VVGGEDTARGVMGSADRQLPREPGRRGEDDVHRQRGADDPGRADQHVPGRHAERARRFLAHPLGVGEAGGARARIGVAAVDHDSRGAAAILRQPPPRKHDRRGDELVLGEHRRRGDRAPVLGGDQRHVEAAPLDAGMAAGGDEARSGSDAHG